MEQQDAFEFSDRRRDMDPRVLLERVEGGGQRVDKLPWGGGNLRASHVLRDAVSTSKVVAFDPKSNGLFAIASRFSGRQNGHEHKA